MSLLSKYFHAFSLGIQSSMEYKANFLLGFASLIFPLTIQFYLWTSIFNNSTNNIVYGYTHSQIIAYSIFAALVSKLVAGGFEWEVLDDIKNGGLNKFIIKPVGYFQYRISCFLGQKSFNTLIILAIICIAIFILNSCMGFKTSIENFALFFVSIFLANTVNFMIYFSLAALAFWVTEAWGAFVILGVVVNIVSGGIFPLDIFGDKLLRLFNMLPFQYTIYFPVNILSGRLDLRSILMGFLVQGIWVFIMLIVTNIVWKIGMKKYTAVGG